MREGWEMKKLGEVCDIKPPKKIAKEKLGLNELVSFIPMKYLLSDEKYFSSPEVKTLEKAYSGYVYLENNDIVLAKITPCFENGKLGIAKGLKNGIGFGSSEYIVYRVNKKLIPEFLYYYLSQESFRKKGTSLMTGAVGHKRIPKEFYENYEIPIPPFTEQKQIVNLLDSAFAKIDQAKANIEKNIANAKELFQSRLNEVFSQKGDGWKEKSLGELTLNLLQGINTSTDKTVFTKDGIPILQAKEIGEEELNLNKCKFISQEDFLNVKERYKAQKGDILLNNIGSSLGRCIEVNWDFEFTFAWNVMRVIPNKNLITPTYLKLGIQSPEFQKSIWGKTKGVGMPFISKKNISELSIYFPNKTEQIKLTPYLEKVQGYSKKSEAFYSKKLELLEDLKKSLLEKAFAGELT